MINKDSLSVDGDCCSQQCSRIGRHHHVHYSRNLTSHAKSQYTDASDMGLDAVMAQQTELCQLQLEPNSNKWLHHRAGASRCCVAVAAVEKRWYYLKEGISLPLYQILEMWYLTTSFLWMALAWPQVSMWGILIRFLTRIYASVVGFPCYLSLLLIKCKIWTITNNEERSLGSHEEIKVTETVL